MRCARQRLPDRLMRAATEPARSWGQSQHKSPRGSTERGQAARARRCRNARSNPSPSLSNQCGRTWDLPGNEVILERGVELILENLAVPFRRPAETPGRDTGRTMEGAHKIGEIRKADV